LLSIHSASAAEPEEEEETAEDGKKSANLPFTQMALSADAADTGPAPLKIALSSEPGNAFTASLDGDEISGGIKRLLADAKTPKQCTITSLPARAGATRRASGRRA